MGSYLYHTMKSPQSTLESLTKTLTGLISGPMDSQLMKDTTNTDQVNHTYPSLPISEMRCSEELHGSHGGCLEDTTRRPPRQIDGSTTADVSSVQTQLGVLRKQREELISINNKWAAQYNVMTQYYKGKVREQQRSVETSQPTLPPNEAVPEDGEAQHVEEEKDVEAEKSEEKVMSRTDGERLRLQNAHLTRRGQHQCVEIRRLNQALQEALESRVDCGESKEDLQDNVWKHQAEVYKEDFLKERMDRERLKGKLLELEKKYRKTHGELHTLKSKVTWAPVIAPPVALCNCTNQVQPPNNYNKCPCAGRQPCPNRAHQSGS